MALAVGVVSATRARRPASTNEKWKTVDFRSSSMKLVDGDSGQRSQDAVDGRDLLDVRYLTGATADPVGSSILECSTMMRAFWWI